MIVRRKLTVLDFAAYFGLAIEYDSTLPAGIQGCLEPGDDPRFVLINRKRSAGDLIGAGA